MSIVNKTIDERYNFTLIQGGIQQVGRLYTKVASGGNYLPGEPGWTPHGYTLTLSDKCDGIRRVYTTPEPQCLGSYPPARDYWASVWMTDTRPWDANDTLILYGKLGRKYDDMVFNTPVFAGELGKSVDMLADRFRQLAEVGRAVRHGNIRRAAKLLGVKPPRKVPVWLQQKRAKTPEMVEASPFLQRDQTITSAWLELTYGWKPLITDISDLAQAIAERDKPRKQRLFANHKIPKFVETSAPRLIAKGRGVYRKSIVAYVEEVLPSLATRMGLHDPASIAWELTPFSFVADWVLPVGDYLAARSLVSRLKGKFVLTTTDKYSVRATETLADPYYCQTGGSEIIGLVWDTSVRVTRQVSDSLPAAPLPTFKIPFKGPGARLASAVSLVREVFGGKTSHRV